MLGWPTLALAGTGGVGLGGSQTHHSSRANTSSGQNQVGVVQPGDQTVTASSGGITLTTHESALLRNNVRFDGSIAPAAAGTVVEIERLGRQTGWTWVATTHATTGSGGSFVAVWHANHIGRFQFRAVASGGAPHAAAAAAPSVTVTVYRQSVATMYGPGFWGGGTACGETLHRNTLGVANRTLPCGTLVSLYYGGRTIVVPVIDRGPYANGADWDLTMATAKALGMTETVTIGAVSLPARSR
jgi:hypothetical protein